jgi:hypothetical protein
MCYATPDFVAEVGRQCSASFLRFLLTIPHLGMRSCLKRVVLVSTSVSVYIEADELADVDKSIPS